MNNLKDYILEKFQITKDSIPYTHHPKDKFELREILEERLSKDKNADLNDIDVSLITDMGAYKFVNTRGLFEDLDPHNIKIDKWDVSNVENMGDMFHGCKNFEGKGLENWKVSKVKSMTHMFIDCKSLNCNLGDWDVRNAEYINFMFACCENFKGEGLEKWKPIKCKNMYNMFVGCDSLKKKPSWYKK